MVRRAPQQNKGSSPSATARKGRLVEQIVGWLYDADDVMVEQRVRLPTRHNSADTREIDVLLTVRNSVYPIRFAVECKNEVKAVGSPYIGEFISKLEAVGIPAHCGIYVATSRYTAEAMRYAQSRGVRTLVLSGLTRDRLLAQFTQAAQSIVYLVPTLTQVQATNDAPGPLAAVEVYGLYDEQGRYRGLVPDLAWYLWATGRIPAQLGRHDVDVPLPERWSNMIGGTCYHVHAVRATVEVVGLVATLIGTAQQHALAQAHDARADRFKLGVTFDLSLLYALSASPLARRVLRSSTGTTVVTAFVVAAERVSADELVTYCSTSTSAPIA
jgi:Restriction endonuclease